MVISNRITSKLIKFSYTKLLLLFILMSCIEEFVPEDITFEDILVVEATLTDEFKFHEIKLSRTFRFNQEQPHESGANVKLIDDLNNEYLFEEADPGTYISSNEFAIQPRRIYSLKISTKNNASYTSAEVMLPSNSSQITDVTYAKAENSEGDEGIEILVDSFDPSGNAKYYRYVFEETQRIVAPNWGAQKIIIISDTPPFKVDAIPKTEENRVCYKTTINKSNIIQTQTNGLTEDRITKFPVKFISKSDSIIRDRYSILVKQHVQTLEAYNYFKTLDEFSSSESTFNENQPGFLTGNISSTTNSNEKVIGFFEINSVSSKRLFINYNDVFPNENTLPYFTGCVTSKPALTDPVDPNSSPLINLLKEGRITYLQRVEDFFGNFVEDPPFEVVNIECGDCTFYGSNIKPDFWID